MGGRHAFARSRRFGYCIRTKSHSAPQKANHSIRVTIGTDMLKRHLMRGKTIVITGGTSGIGEVAAEKFAGMGARIVLVARSRSRGAVTLARLERLAPGRGHKVYYADLSQLIEMKRVANEIVAAEPRIDVLINNAGALFNDRRVTSDHLEYTFATNHMAYFVLTEILRDRLIESAPARIINTASAAHERGSLDLDDLQSEKSFFGYRAYSTSKLCNILFTRVLAQRLQGTGVTVNCLHPGFVASRFGDASGGLPALALRVFKIFAISPEQGAETMVYLASSPEVAQTSGKYFANSRTVTPSRAACDDRLAQQLWDRTALLAGLG
jgi:NAD(P)-dependent dehydrogenase (short-subunit alcohol dehydrogenase family)